MGWIIGISIVVLLIWGFFRLADKNRTPHELERRRIIEDMKKIPDKEKRREYYEEEMSKTIINK
jgi:hypothetical protein